MVPLASRCALALALVSVAPLASAQTAPEAPFAFGDFTWMNGQSRQRDFPLTAFGGAVTLSLYLDTHYAYSLNRPIDNTLTGTGSAARHNEFSLNLASVGFEVNYRNVLARMSLQFGDMLNIVQDLDGTVSRGRSISTANLRNIREATLGYHFNVGHGLNVESGIFMSYIGLESFLLAENWTYARSLVCEHTAFYFQGVRVQYFPTRTIKIEPWLMNGWQSYGRWNQVPSAGMAFRWSPREWFTLFANVYVGTDTRGVPDRVRVHHDHSVIVRYYQRMGARGLTRLAVSVNNHAGFEDGGAGLPGPSEAYMLGTSVVHRAWFLRDHLGLTVRGEVFANGTGYLAQYAPPSLVTGPGSTPIRIAGVTATVDVMPTDFLALRAEVTYRTSNVDYFAGPGGTTSPDGFQPTPMGFTADTRKSQTVFVLAANFRL